MEIIQRTVATGGFAAAAAVANDIVSGITGDGGTVLKVLTYDVTGSIFIVVAYREGK